MFRSLEDESAEFLLAWGLTPPDTARPRGEQTQALLERMEHVLLAYGMSFANVVRTWFYNDRINDWYAEFNAARTGFFESRDVFRTFLPASTGIGHPNPFGAALVSGFVAMRPKDGSARAEIVKSPLQVDAMAYRSSFSRAAETTSASGRRLFVSGTASILPGSNEVAYVGDFDRQVDCTMSAVLAILESRGMSVRDVTRAIAYLKDPRYLQRWRTWLRAHDLPPGFATVLIADVCRPDWLFEIELDGFSGTGRDGRPGLKMMVETEKGNSCQKRQDNLPYIV